MNTTLQNKVEQLYGISIVAAKPFEGKEGEVYFLCTSAGEMVLRKYSPGLTQERIANQHYLTQQLRSQGLVVVPQVYPASSTHVEGITLSPEHPTFFTYRDSNFSLHEFKKGTPYSWNDNELSDTCRVLASFHMRLKQHTEGGYHYTDKFEEVLGELGQLERQISEAKNYSALNSRLIMDLKNLIPLIKDYRGTIERVRTSQTYEPLLADYTVIHGDFHQKNVLFLDGRVNAILDLDSVRTDRRVYEVAFALFEFTSIYIQDGGIWRFDRLDPQKASLFIDAYQQHYPLKGPLIEGMYIMLMERFFRRLSYGLGKIKNGNRDENIVVREMINSLNRLHGSLEEVSLWRRR